MAERLVRPCSTLGTIRLWATTVLRANPGVTDADVDELYAALDRLFRRQLAIERKPAARRETEGGAVPFDVSSICRQRPHMPLFEVRARPRRQGRLADHFLCGDDGRDGPRCAAPTVARRRSGLTSEVPRFFNSRSVERAHTRPVTR